MMFILKYSLACALAALFITGGTSAQDDTVIGFNLPQDSARTSVVRSARAATKFCLSDADRKSCSNQITAKYPLYEKALPNETTAEVYCMGLVWWYKCCMRIACKNCKSKTVENYAANKTKTVKKVFTTGNCMQFKPPGDLNLSCSKDIHGFKIPDGYTWSGNFGENSAGTSAGTSAGNSAEAFSGTSASKSLQIIAKVAGALVVFGLIGGLLFFFIFKKKGSGNNKVATGAATASKKKKKAASKTGKSTVKSSASKQKSTTGGGSSGVKSSKSSATKPKTSIRGAKSSKSTTA